MSALIEEVRTILRSKQYSIKTEKAYLDWIKRFIRFHDYQHPKSMGKTQVEEFLSHLATHRRVSAATQNLALCSLFLNAFIRGRHSNCARATWPQRFKNN